MLTGGVQSGSRAENEPRWIQKGVPRGDTIDPFFHHLASWVPACSPLWSRRGPESLPRSFQPPKMVRIQSKIDPNAPHQRPDTASETMAPHQLSGYVEEKQKLTIQPMEKPCTPLAGWPTRLSADLRVPRAAAKNLRHAGPHSMARRTARSD